MLIGDYLKNPNRNLATGEEDDALTAVLRSCGSANTALLQLLRVARISHEEVAGLQLEIERMRKLFQDKRERFKSVPVDGSGQP